jgi:hypothetical protein
VQWCSVDAAGAPGVAPEEAALLDVNPAVFKLAWDAAVRGLMSAPDR